MTPTKDTPYAELDLKSAGKLQREVDSMEHAKLKTDNTELGEIFAKHGILPPNSNPAHYGSHISIVEPVYTELLSEITKLLEEQDIKSRIDELEQFKYVTSNKISEHINEHLDQLRSLL